MILDTPNLNGQSPVVHLRISLVLLTPETFQTGIPNSLLSTKHMPKLQKSDKSKNWPRLWRSKLPRKISERMKKSEGDQSMSRRRRTGSRNRLVNFMTSIESKLGLKRLKRKHRNLLSLKTKHQKRAMALTITMDHGQCRNSERKRWILIEAIFLTTVRACQHN